MCRAQGPQRSDAGEARTNGPSVSSQALYHWATALLIIIIFGGYATRYFVVGLTDMPDTLGVNCRYIKQGILRVPPISPPPPPPKKK